MNDYIYSTNILDGNISCGISGAITGSKIYPDRIAVDELKKELFPEKKVIPEKPKTIDQMVASALSRLHVSINAEADWASFQITREFNKLRNKYLLKQEIYGDFIITSLRHMEIKELLHYQMEQ